MQNQSVFRGTLRFTNGKNQQSSIGSWTLEVNFLIGHATILLSKCFLFSPLHAVSFAAVSGTTGLIILNYGVNGVCASLGALTLALYTLVYTPMKRSSIANTWVGSIGMTRFSYQL